MKRDDDDDKVIWRRPTRRSFVAMLGAAAAALAIRTERKQPDRAPQRDSKPLWIGHV